MTLQRSSRYEGIEISEIRRMNNLARPDTINLGIGQLPFPVPVEVRDAAKFAFDNGKTQYSPNPGVLELRNLVAKEHSSRVGKLYCADNVVITNGVEGALWNIFDAFLNPGDEVLIPEVYFSVYDTIPRMHGAKPVTYALTKDFGVDVSDLESKINPRTKFVVLNSPSNPTGRVLSEQELRDVVRAVGDTAIISDEVYGSLLFNGQRALSVSEFSNNVIVANGISKRASATGLRIGWTIASKDISQVLTVANQYTTACASTPCQYAAIPVVQGKCVVYESDVLGRLDKNRITAVHMLGAMRNVSIVEPQGAFYCFPDISHFGASKDVAMKLLIEGNVLTIPGIAFGSDRHIRISYAVKEEALVKGLEKMAQVLL